MLKSLQQLPLPYTPILIAQVIQVDALIPRRYDELRRLRIWRELEGGDGIGWRRSDGELI